MTTLQQTLSRDEVVQRIRAIVIEALHAQKMTNQITEQTLLGNIGLDSLNVVDILLGIETEFDMTFDDEDLDLSTLETLGSLVAFVLDAQNASL